MSAAAIAQLIVILAPLAKEVWVEGSKVVASFRDDLSQDDINTALERTRSNTWPELTFK